jgi:hypothetical protein
MPTTAAVQTTSEPSREDWKKVDFHALKSAQFQKLDSIIDNVKQSQRDQRNNHTNVEFAKVEQLIGIENVRLQRDIGKTLEEKRSVLAEIDRENHEFKSQY